MSYEEKNTWAYGITTLVFFLIYLAIVLPMIPNRPLSEVPYQWPMIWTIVGAIVVGIATSIVLSVTSPKNDTHRDIRDKEISRFGDNVGQAMTIIGGVTGLLLALISAEPFWIANTIYLGFVLSGVLSTIARLSAYRFGFQPW